MRELKFRVWFKEHYDYYKLDDFCGVDNRYFLEDTIVEQYTGLKDKNGKEIYEGDILRWENSKFSFEDNGVVVYEHGGWCVTNTICTLWACITLYKAEVVGNIHENKEFLNGHRED